MSRQDRSITLAGDFNQSVEITNSLMNGESCSASDYGHAEGYKSNSEGKYSYAGGYSAYAKHNNSFVWSGRMNGSLYMSAGDGTFNIYTNSNASDPLGMVYLDGETLESRISDTFGSRYLNSNILGDNNNWTSKNTFGGGSSGGIVLSGVSFAGDVNSNMNMAGDTSFSGTLKSKTPTYIASPEGGAGSLAPVATTQYVKDLFSSSLGALSNNYVKRGNSPSQIGSSTKPVYINSDGNAVAIDGNAVLRGDNEATLGGNASPVYMEGGYLKRSDASIGGNTKMMYMSGGDFRESNANVCNDAENPSLMSLSSGSFVKSSASTGNNLRPVYLENGVFKPIGRENGNDHSLGGLNQPIYINTDGSFAVCNQYSGGGSDSGIKSISIDNENVETNMFLTAVKKNSDTPSAVMLNLIKGRPTMSNIDGLLDEGTSEGKLSWSSRAIGSLRSSCATYSTMFSSLNTNLPKVYAFPMGISSKMAANNGTLTSGNTIIGYWSTQQSGNNNASIGLIKGNRLEGLDTTTGAGNCLKSISVSNNKIKPELCYSVQNVTGQGTGSFVSSISYTNGTLKAYYGTPSTGGGGGSSVDMSPTILFKTYTVPAVEINGNTGYEFRFTDYTSGWTMVALMGISIDGGTETYKLRLKSFMITEKNTVVVKVHNASDHKITTSVTVNYLVFKDWTFIYYGY